MNYLFASLWLVSAYLSLQLSLKSLSDLFEGRWPMAIIIIHSRVMSSNAFPLPDSDIDLHLCWSARAGAGAQLLVVAAPEQRVQHEGDAPPELLPS